jgi:hypothetical protein
MHAPKFLTSGKFKFKPGPMRLIVTPAIWPAAWPRHEFRGIMSSLISAMCARRLGRATQTGVSQACGKKNCYGNGAGNQPCNLGEFLNVGL